MSDEPKFFTGKTPARQGATTFKFARYFDAAALPTPPRRFGHYRSVPQWAELGNDKCGDCVFAGGGHETMLWGAANKRPIGFSAVNTIKDYSALTGYSSWNPLSDRGTDMEVAAKYRRTTGLQDASGARHKVDAYVSVHPGDVGTIALAAYLFGAIGFGMVFPKSAEQQFTNHQPWDVVPGSHTDGGHYVPVVGRNSAGNLLLVTWGRLHAMTPRFVEAYNDEILVYLSLEWLDQNTMLSPDNFDRAALVADLAAL